MKTLMLVPPAQAEALYDAQTEMNGEDPRFEDRFTRLPWIDDDAAEEIRSRSPLPPSAGFHESQDGARVAA